MTTPPTPAPGADPERDPQSVSPDPGAEGAARRPTPFPRDPSAARPAAPPVRRRVVPARSAPPPSPLTRYHAQLLARRRLRALAAMTGGLGSAALLAMTGFGAPVAGAGAVEVAADGRLDPQAWVLPGEAGMGPLVVPTIGALPPGSADWFLPGAPAAAVGSPAVAVSSIRQAVRAAEPDLPADLEAELGLDPGPGRSSSPAAPTTAPPPSAADRGESREQFVAPPTHPAPPAGPTAPATPLPPSVPASSVQPSPATTLPPSGPSSSVQPSPATTPPATTLPPADPTPADPSPADPSPADPSPVDPSPAAPSPADPPPVDSSPAAPSPADPSPADPSPADPSSVDPPPAEEPPPVEEPPPAEPPVEEPPPAEPPVEEPPPAEPAEPAPVVLVPGAAVEVADPAAGGSALTVTVEHVLASASCADASVVAGNGTLVAVRITVTTGADLAVLGGERSLGPGDFRLVGDDGSVATGGAPAGSCDTGAAAFPGGPLAPSSAVTGTVVLDVPARSGTVVFRPDWL